MLVRNCYKYLLEKQVIMVNTRLLFGITVTYTLGKTITYLIVNAIIKLNHIIKILFYLLVRTFGANITQLRSAPKTMFTQFLSAYFFLFYNSPNWFSPEKKFICRLFLGHTEDNVTKL